MKVGDRVYLKSDPAPLTILSIDDNDVAKVLDHDPNGFKIEKEYPLACLQEDNPFPPPEPKE